LDLKPARLSAREKEWAGSGLPSVDHSWLTDIETLARAQLSCLSAFEWLFGVFFASQENATPEQLDALKGFAIRELQQATDFGGALIASATLAHRKAILDSLAARL